MITVEKVLENDAKKGSEIAQENEELLKTGSAKSVKRSYWPWVLVALAAIGFGIWFYKKNNGHNEGVHN